MNNLRKAEKVAHDMRHKSIDELSHETIPSPDDFKTLGEDQVLGQEQQSHPTQEARLLKSGTKHHFRS